MDPVQFRCQNPGRSIFGRGKKWTRSSFAVEIQAGPFLAGEKSGPGPVSLLKSRQVQFLAGEKSGPGPVSCRNPGRSIFGRGKKWIRSSFLPKSRQVHFWQGKKVDPVQFPAEIQAGPILAGEKSGPGPVSCRNPGRSIFGRGKKWTRSSFLPKSRQVHFWQGKKVDPVQFPAEIQAGPFLAGEKSGPGPVSCRNPGRSIFGRGKKWTRSSFAVEIQAGPFLAGEKSGPGQVSLSKSRQVHFWQWKKVDLVKFCCRNPGRSIFGRGKKWTRSSFAAEIQVGPFLAGEKSGPGPVLAGEKSGPGLVLLSKSKQVHFWQGKKVDPVQFPAEIKAGPLLAGEKSGPGPVSLSKSRQVHFWRGKKVDPVKFRCRNPGRSIFGGGKKWTRSSFAAEIQAGPFLARE